MAEPRHHGTVAAATAAATGTSAAANASLVSVPVSRVPRTTLSLGVAGLCPARPAHADSSFETGPAPRVSRRRRIGKENKSMQHFAVHYYRNGVWRRAREIRARTIGEAAATLGPGFGPWPFTSDDHRQYVGFIGTLRVTVTETATPTGRFRD